MTLETGKGTMPRDVADARLAAASDLTLRLVGAMLALSIAAVHIADQGGVTALDSPAWIGWGYRAIEAGGVLTALFLLLPGPARLMAGTRWAPAVLLGVGPFTAYILSRTVGVPGDHGDIGNWDYWVGTVSLFVEAALLVLSISMLLSLRPLPGRGARGYELAK